MSVLTQEGIGEAVLSDNIDGDGPYTIHGTAIGTDDVTIGQSGLKKIWPAETLREAATTLENTPLVVDHENRSVFSVVGEVMKAKYEDGEGVLFEAEIDDKELAMKVDRGRLDVSPRIQHESVEEMEENDDGALVVKEATFINLSLVPIGASPSASVEFGSSTALAAAELRQAFDYEMTEPTEEEELAEHSVHEPSFSSTREAPWNKPSLEDFTDDSWDDLSSDEKGDIADHFIGSKTGFPPENFGDLFLPVVDSEGNLVLNALQNAKARVGQVSGLSDEDQNRAENIINRLADDNFDDADFSEMALDVEEGGLHTFKMSLFDRPLSENQADSVANSLSGIDGLTAVSKAGEDNPQVVVIVDPDEISDNLNEEIRNRLEDTPFVVRDEFDWVEWVVREESKLGKDEPEESENSILTEISPIQGDDRRDDVSTEDIVKLPLLK